MAAPLTPKPTRKAEALAKAPPTIASSREEDAALKEVALPRYRCANGILETKAKDESTAAKASAPRTNPNTKELKGEKRKEKTKFPLSAVAGLW